MSDKLDTIIDEEIQAYLKENAASAGGVAGHAGRQDDLNEDNYEDSGEPWDPKSSSYPFQHPQKGLLLRYKNRDSFNVWADNWRKENPDGQLTKAVRVAPKGGGRISIGSGVPFRRRYEEGITSKSGRKIDVGRADDEQLNEEGADCIRDYMAMGHSYGEAVRICSQWYDASNEPRGLKLRLQEKDEQLDEGALKNFMTMLAIMVGGQAAAMEVDLGGGTVASVEQIAQVLKADGTSASASAAKDVVSMIKANPEDVNDDGNIDVHDSTEHNMPSISVKHIKKLIDAGSQSAADSGSASGKPDVSGMNAPDARRALYDYYKSIGFKGSTAMMVNNDLRNAGVGQMSDADRQKAQKDQADMAAKIKKSGIRESSI